MCSKKPPSSLLILLKLSHYDTDKTHHRRRLCVQEISTRIRIDTHMQYTFARGMMSPKRLFSCSTLSLRYQKRSKTRKTWNASIATLYLEYYFQFDEFGSFEEFIRHCACIVPHMPLYFDITWVVLFIMDSFSFKKERVRVRHQVI